MGFRIDVEEEQMGPVDALDTGAVRAGGAHCELGEGAEAGEGTALFEEW